MGATKVKGGVTPVLNSLDAGIKALEAAAAQLDQARELITRAKGPGGNAQLLGEEVSDVLIRVRVEREKLDLRVGLRR
jgi:hypothetical protein